ncbi:MAG: VIT1/CCC1 family protein [Actinomycetaceae bacterium]|nr:VIT1/CCC1 family protein [Actinomycetaceae bacterium]
MATKTEIRKWRAHLASERQEAATYAYLAGKREGEEREVLIKLADAERRHEQYWLDKLGLHAYPAPTPPLRTRLMSRLAKTFGSIFVLAMAQASEGRNASSDISAQMAADERIHSEVVRALAGRQRAAMAGTFRAAVFGANDGLVSNLALILGVVGAGAGSGGVLTAGLSGLLAGALSMGAGEYISVCSQRELLEASNPDPKMGEAVAHLDLAANELALVYRARGVRAEEAEALAEEILRNLELKQEEQVGHNYEEIGDGWKAALSSFAFFATGAFVPVFPFLLPLSLGAQMGTATALVAIALFISGGIVGILSGAAPGPRALRQLLIGLGAAGVTWAIGTLTGTLT